MGKFDEYKLPLQTLVEQYMWIKALKRSVDELFENDKIIKLMERMAKEFFQQLNVLMIHQLILSYCKFTDPSTKMGSNLTIDYFTSIKEDEICNNENIKTGLSQVNAFRNYIVPARNKIIAHNDLETHIAFKELGGFPEGDDNKFINGIESILNELSRIINGDIYGDFIETLSGDVFDFIKILRYANGMLEMFENERDDQELFHKIVNYMGIGRTEI